MIRTLFITGILLTTLKIANAQTLSVALWREVSHIDPVYTTTVESLQIMSALFETLVLVNEQNQVVPGQAESWKISKDGKTYTFHLRDNIFWSDGEPVSAADFVLGFQRILDKDLTLMAKPDYLLEKIKNFDQILNGKLPIEALGIYAADNKTLIIELVSPASYFLKLLAYSGLTAVPQHVIEKFGNINWAKPDNLVSNGPFILEKKDAESLTMRRNDKHWHQVNYDKLIYKYYITQDAAVGDIVSKELDIAIDLTRKQSEWLSNKTLGKIHSYNLDGVFYGILNYNNPKFTDLRLRRALSMAIDRQYLTRNLHYTEQNIATQFTPTTSWRANKESLPDWHKLPYEVRLEQARQTFKELGYSDQNPLEILILARKKQEYERLGIAIRAMWASLPVKTSFVSETAPARTKRLRQSDFDFAIMSWVNDYPDPLSALGLLRNSSGGNYSGWHSKRYDKTLDMAYRETDTDARNKLLNKLEQIIAEETAVFPLVYPSEMVYTSNKIKDYFFSMSSIWARNVILKTSQ